MQINNKESERDPSSVDIAIIGLSGRFPGAKDLQTFWKNLIENVETIQKFTKEELVAEGICEELLDNPNYVKAKGILNDIEWFDASFFGYNPQDARMTDPQQKLFLECAWEALESAGYVPEKCKGLIGVYTSMADSTYLQNNLLKNKEVLQSFDWFQTRISTSLTTLSGQLSYRLNLTGPSVNLTTACSSSLVVITTACRELIGYACDLAIAGAAAIAIPQKTGYLYHESGIESPDGSCRAFDAKAKGTVFSNGLGVVILKRLEDAIQDNDHIYAVIKGWNINNDGSDKLGFSAPSVSGQAACVASALAFSDINPSSLSYLEAHGTGTELGDLIELNALTDAFKQRTDKKQYCAIGSVKTNIGHTDIASGMASFIKSTLALKNKMIPATLHYREPNPKIDFTNTPFFVNSKLTPWEFGERPRRAGINASGIGGTNSFLILEEYDVLQERSSNRSHQLLLLSAKTKTGLETITQNLIQHLETMNNSEILPDVAFTLQVGRADFNYRRMIVCEDLKDALFKLKNLPREQVITKNYKSDVPSKIVFMFSGQGTQYIGMAKNLYYSEPQFAKWIDICGDRLDAQIKKRVYSLIFENPTSEEINNTFIVQPALFIIEYALAKFLMEVGIQPKAMIGHSLGEYVAACIAGVISLEDILKLICYRAELMASTKSGIMLAIQIKEEDLLDLVNQKNVSIAAINAPTSCVIAGATNKISTLENELKEKGIIIHKLKTSHAFHSELMEPILTDFRRMLTTINFKSPQIPYISNVTGDWIKEEEATDPDYWCRHLRHTVKFLQGLQTLINNDYNIFLEIGPGKTLTNLAKELITKDPEIFIQNTLPTLKDLFSDQESILISLGQLWLHGAKINWANFYKYEKRQRLPLPTYPFERKLYWIYPDKGENSLVTTKKQPYHKWFYEPSWTRSSLSYSNFLPEELFLNQVCWIIFHDEYGVGDEISKILSQHNNQLVIKVKSAKNFDKLNDFEYSINIEKKEDYQSLCKEIYKLTSLPINLINLFPLTKEHDNKQLDLKGVRNTLYFSFYSSLFFTQSIIELQVNNNINILIVTNEVYSIIGTENIYPAKATVTGPCRVIPQEHPHVKVRALDVILSESTSPDSRLIICNQIISDAFFTENNIQENIIAYRGEFRWSQVFRPLKFITSNSKLNLKAGGVYLLTGGLGGISLTIANTIAKSCKNSNFILISRTQFPGQDKWQEWLLQHENTNKISKQILRLQTIIEQGSKITILQADVANFDDIKSCIDKIYKDFGTINGVLHAAGNPGGGLVQLKTIDIANKVFFPKVEGTYILTHLLRNKPLDFFILCSSVSSILGELSQVDYCAANACLDAFTQTNILKNTTLFAAINWNTWREIGMAVETERPVDISYFDRNNDISPEEGATIFKDILNNRFRQVIVSTYDINSYINLINNNKISDMPNTLFERDEILGEDENYAAPTNNTESELVEIWQNILGIDKIGIHDDFIALGGHSLMALRMIDRIEKKFNTKINLQILQESKTIKALSEKISLQKPFNINNFSDNIVPIRSHGHNAPLFCFHPVSGTVFCYLELAKHLKFDCPIYGLQDPSLKHGKMMFNSLEDMAECYMRALQKIQKHGPYLLSGLSFGATLAIEVAKRLHEKGEEVNPLILFDGWAKFSDEQRVQKVFKEALLRLGKNVNSDKSFSELSWARMKLLLNYQIPSIKDKIILFKAEQLLSEYNDIDQKFNYWDNYALENIELHLVPGNHETILEKPNAQYLSEKLDTILIRLSKDE